VRINQNIYIAELSPRIRIRIGSLGLSKYTGPDSDTVLHTPAGTWEYAAPEVIALSAYDEKVTDHYTSAHDEKVTDHYTSAVDIWSSGCTAHKILTNKLPFGSTSLVEYVGGLKNFPAERLVERNISEPARKLLQRTLAPASRDRPTAKECLEDAWFTTTQAKAVLRGGFEMSDGWWRKEG
jgi:serine/threonine protein kinase